MNGSTSFPTQAKILFSFALIFITETSSTAQVQVTGSSTADGVYPSLSAAFTAMNGSSQAGNNIFVSIYANTSEPVGGAVLNAGTWASIAIQPNGARTVTGNITPGLPLIDLNGADNVTFNGLNSGGHSLSFTNTTVSDVFGTSTIRFINDAKNNIITNCSIYGSSTVTGSNPGATLFFSTAAVVGGTGNDDNTISFCTIGSAGVFLHSKAVHSSGSSDGTSSIYNSGNQLLNNNIQDFFNAQAISNGVWLAEGTINMTISGNRFFQTASRTQTVGPYHSVIVFAHPNNGGHTIANNIIGFANSAGTGQYSLTGQSNNFSFQGIRSGSHSTSMTSNIQGNTISGVALNGVMGGVGAGGIFAGITIGSGSFVITGNTIGSLGQSNSITISTNNPGQIEAYGIFYQPQLSITASNNSIGGIVLNNSGTGSGWLMGMSITSVGSATHTIQNNTIGSANSPLVNSCTGTASRTLGIFSQLGMALLTDNVVSDMTMSASNTNGGISASMIGILVQNSLTLSTPTQISRNIIRRLSNTNTTAVLVEGLIYNGPNDVSASVDRNLIHELGTGAWYGFVTGIRASAGQAVYSNNMIRLGMTSSGQQETIGYGITGLLHGSGSVSFLHNSVYIGGTPVSGGGDTYALAGFQTSGPRSYMNNILFNACSNAGGGGTHYAIRLPNADEQTNCDHNILRATGSGAMLTRLNFTPLPTLAQWRSFTGFDMQSLFTDPNFIAPLASTPDLHINNPTPVESAGSPVGFIQDYDGEIRNDLTPTDIGADAGNFTALCSGTPIAGTSSGATAGCVYDQFVYTNDAVNVAPGITYTWYVSTFGVNGPWTTGTGTGVNTQSYTPSGFSAGTLYIVMGAHCINSGDSALSNVLTLLVHPDSDGDGTCDDVDECPDDPNKVTPGACGCGVPDGVEVCNGIDDDCNGMVDEGCSVNIVLFVLLDGPYNPSTGLMNDGIRAMGFVPTTEPYTAMGYSYVGSSGGTTTPEILAVSGADAVLDWVVVELRSEADPSVIVASRSALIQRDGNVGDVDAGDILNVNAPPGNYYVAVRHRNHLGAMLASPIPLHSGITIVDMISPSTQFYGGVNARKSRTGLYPAQVLWAGDVNFDDQIMYMGAGNDRDPILQVIGGTVPTNQVNGYYGQDLNLDGKVKYSGSLNDRDLILYNIGGVVPTDVKIGTLP